MPSLRLARAHPAPRGRLEVCPPTLFGDTEPFLRRWWRLVRTGDDHAVEPAFTRLLAVRQEFAGTLDDIDSQHAQFVQHRVLHCRSMLELWHLRSELFYLIARAHDEAEAERRIAPLNRHFPTRAPRSGFAPLG